MTQSKALNDKNNDINQKFIDWYSSALGSRVANSEGDALASMVHDLFGYQLLQLGELGNDVDFLASCPIRRRVLLSHRAPAFAGSVIVGQAQQLPIAADSIDAAILVHTLDFSPDPHQVLREVERVLIAEGRVIVVGFNPFSLWGVWRLFGRWRGAVPWSGHFLSYPRLNDWLSLMGFAVERLDVMEFRPPTRGSGLHGVERLGRQVWPMLAGIYVVRAVKRVARVTPLRQRWARLRVRGPRVIEPTVREINDV